ncbi:transmembrane protein 71 [Hyla sarda]|uniref:transmembrane protein 71 n=1 Tax=Hyla sarda TaxID=327740 RepID=UPI0024C2B069|nr:transmembrane protein 71 [Hyla sarda]
MNTEFFKMAAQPPLMSTPKKGKYSSLFQEIALLPYRLFGHCARDNIDSPKMRSPIPSSDNMSPCRHSLRLLSNGYYVCDEDSFCWDDLGNVSFSPTQCTVSYKENMVRIFRKRRRTLVQRRLDLTSHGHPEDKRPLHYEAINDIDPLVVEEICHSTSGLCDSGNPDLYAPTLLDLAESDADYISSGYAQLMEEKSLMTLPHPSNSTKMPEPENSGTPKIGNNGNADLMELIGRFTCVEEKDKGDHQPGRVACGGYMLVNNDTNTCQLSYDINSLGPTERRHVKKHPSDSRTTDITPSIGSVSVGGTRQRRILFLGLIFIPLLLLCLVFWWLRSPDHKSIEIRSETETHNRT